MIRMKEWTRVIILFSAFGLATTHAYAELRTGMPADLVLGQPDFTSNTENNGGVTASSMGSNFGGGFSDGKRLFIADTDNHRVLIWNSIPTNNFTPADIVLGQPDFTSNTQNNGGIGANTLRAPRKIAIGNNKLMVCDTGNTRILIWNSIPTSNMKAADVVVGQPDFVSSSGNQGGGPGANTIQHCRGLASDGTRLMLADRTNQRVLIWNTIPTTNNASADVVLGQPNFTSSTANNGGIGANTLNFPHGVGTDGQRIFVADSTNHRVLIWNSIPTTNMQPADVVLGQPDFVTATSGTSATIMAGPRTVTGNGSMVFVNERNNNRILIYTSIPTKNGAAADVVIGQQDFTSSTSGVSRNRLDNPEMAFSDGKRLFIVERANSRVLIFNVSTESNIALGPQFDQGKGVLGKVFHDTDGDGRQGKEEAGIEGVKVASDTGIYAITDEDGKYHFPFIEIGQHLLKIDPSTLPEGSEITTDSPYRINVTKGVLTKVSFGVSLPEGVESFDQFTGDGPMLKVSVSQDPTRLKPYLSAGATRYDDKIEFTINTNYFLFIETADLIIYDKGYTRIKEISLTQPIPSRFEIDSTEFPFEVDAYYYQLFVYDRHGKEDRTSFSKIR